MSRRLCACLLNVSEARDSSKILSIAEAALKVNTPGKELRAALLNIFQDKDYNRSVLTIVGSLTDIGESVISASTQAFQCIDLREHEGGHPRLGAVDLIPIHPISPSVSLDDCATIAKEVSSTLSKAVPGTSFFLAGHAHHAKQGLVARRKEVKWFSGCHGSSYAGLPYDVGAQPTQRYGLTGVAAIPYVTNCNVTIDSRDLGLGRRIAHALRATTPGGFPGVQAMAFAHEGKVEIACNIQGVIVEDEGEWSEDGGNRTRNKNTEDNKDNEDSAKRTVVGKQNNDADSTKGVMLENEGERSEDGGNRTRNKNKEDNEHNAKRTVVRKNNHHADGTKDPNLVRTCGACHHVPAVRIEDRVRAMAREGGVHTVDAALIVGFEPAECERLANIALNSGAGDFWKTRTKRTM